MAFGIRLFGGNSPSKQAAQPDVLNETEQVESTATNDTSTSTTDTSVADSDETVDIPLDHVEGGRDGSSTMASGLGAQYTGRDSTATARLSTFSAFTVGGRSSNATIIPSVSVMMNQSSAGLNAQETSNEPSRDTAHVPLTAIPDFILNDHPELKLAEYDLTRTHMCSNAIAMPHNACRLEMSDMWTDILPSLQSRPIDALTREDAHDLQAWWGGFARFSLTSSLVDDYVMGRAFKDIIEDFDKDAQLIKRANRKFEEKNTVTLEIVCRAMGKAVELFCEHMTADHLQQLIVAWQNLSMTLSDIYTLVEKTLHDIDRWRRDEIAKHKDLEKKIAHVYTNKKRWGNDDSKRGEMVVVLTRWVGSEHLMREWMQRNLTKRELRCIDRWMDEYRGNRLQIIDSFHQRRAL